MGAVVKINGREIPESLVTVDTANNRATFETMDDIDKSLDLRRVYVEVNIFGAVSIADMK